MYAYDLDGTGSITGQTTSDMVVVGTMHGSGVLGRQLLSSGDATKESTATLTGANVSGISTLSSFTNGAIEKILSPPNGMAQFKGLSSSASEQLYL